jgi:uncharacterized metal-binding protein YceD (DUF177 family)
MSGVLLASSSAAESVEEGSCKQGLDKHNPGTGLLARLDALTVTPVRDIQVDWVFGRNVNGRAACWGTVQCNASLSCQRCLEPCDHVVVAHTQLEFLNANGADVSSPEWEPCVESGEPLSLYELVEDELLLAMPFAPHHPDGECNEVYRNRMNGSDWSATQGSDGGSEVVDKHKIDRDGKRKPFADLAQLMSEQERQK